MDLSRSAHAGGLARSPSHPRPARSASPPHALPIYLKRKGPRAGSTVHPWDVGCAMSPRLGLFAMIIASVIVPLAPSLASAQASGVPVSTGSPPGPFPQNKQNEPAVAIDPLDPRLVVAGANDEIDLAPCAGSSCPFTPGVRISGV